MAGVKGHQKITKGLFDMLMAGERGMKADVQEAALEAAIAGEDKVREIIDTTESSLSPGKDNRNWTFQMRQAVDSDVKRNGNTITVRTGWLQKKETYFLIQNDGGDLVRNGNTTTITPMNALMAGHDAMLDTLKGWGIKVK
jgi:hypothetical protein